MNAFERNKKLLELIQFAENSGNNMGGGTQNVIPENAQEYLSTSPTVGANPYADAVKNAPSIFKPWNILREKLKAENLTGVGSGDIWAQDVEVAKSLTGDESMSIIDEFGNHKYRGFGKEDIYKHYDKLKKENPEVTYTIVPTSRVDAYQSDYENLLYNQEKILRPIDRKTGEFNVDNEYIFGRASSGINAPFVGDNVISMIDEIRLSQDEIGRPVVKPFNYYNEKFSLGFDPDFSARAAAGGEGIWKLTTRNISDVGDKINMPNFLGTDRTSEDREIFEQHYAPIMRLKKGEIVGSEGQKQGKAFLDEFVKTKVPMGEDTNTNAFNKMVELDSLLQDQLESAIRRRDDYLRTKNLSVLKNEEATSEGWFETESLADIDNVINTIPPLLIKNRAFIAKFKEENLDKDSSKTELVSPDSYPVSDTRSYRGIDLATINGEIVPLRNRKKKKNK